MKTAMSSATATLEAQLGSGAEAETIRAHLRRVLASGEFAGTARLANFLTFVVETSLAGEADQIKESLIAIEVYGRRPDYNPQVDSTVRVEAGRLRGRLRRYYEGTGANETVRIELPKGTYAPVFQCTQNQVAAKPVVAAKPPVRRIHVLACASLMASGALAAMLVRMPDSVDPKTMELYHRAEELLRIPVLKNGVPESLPASVVESAQLFREVTTRSPQFARGWMGLAEVSEWEYELRGNKPPELLSTARLAVDRAIALDPNLKEAWTLLTSILLYRQWDFREAEKACRRALDLDPRNTTARKRLIDALRVQGRTAEARIEIERAITLQPAGAVFHVRKAMMLYEAGNCDEAIPIAVTASDLTNQIPVYPATLWVQALCLEQRRQYPEAERMFRRVLSHQPNDPWSEPALGHLLGISGHTSGAQTILTELRRQLARGRTTHVAMALVYTSLGKNEDAIASLERAWRERDDMMLFIGTDPRFRPLHSDPRFHKIVTRLQRQ